MGLLKRARTYGTRCGLLLAFVTTLSGLAQTRPTASPARLTKPSRAHIEAAVPPDETRVATKQKAEPHHKDSWTDEQLIRPEELLLSSAEKPLVLHVGMAFLFKGGHIPGSKYAGQASTAEGLGTLKKTVQALPPNQGIVLYCGCCPLKDCPNVAPAFKTLREMRFTNVKVLYLLNSFAQDWVEKGFPIEK